VAGRRNLILLRAVILVLLGRGSGTGGRPWPFGLLEVALGGIALLSYRITPRAIHRANRFSFGPIASVAVIFAGIFVTMTQPLLMLNARAAEIGLSTPGSTLGVLSSTLDNRGGGGPTGDQRRRPRVSRRAGGGAARHRPALRDRLRRGDK
jgi:hypothetical protein